MSESCLEQAETFGESLGFTMDSGMTDETSWNTAGYFKIAMEHDDMGVSENRLNP